MRVVLLGPPGAGKGTQAELIENRLSIPHISTGDLLRDAVAAESELGLAAKDYMARGELVPDEMVVQMIEGRMTKADCQGGYLLDGFPRNVAQAEVLGRMLNRRSEQLDHVVFLQVPREELVERLTGRKRADDTEETIRARLEVYANETQPLCDYYRSRGCLREVEGVGAVREILGRILTELEASRNSSSRSEP